MESMTFLEFLNKTNKKPNQIKEETGLSLAMISRLKKGDLKITSNTKKIFKSVYDVELLDVNQDNKKDEYIKEIEANNNVLEEKVKGLSTELFKRQKNDESLERRDRLIESFIYLPLSVFDKETCDNINKIIKKSFERNTK